MIFNLQAIKTDTEDLKSDLVSALAVKHFNMSQCSNDWSGQGTDTSIICWDYSSEPYKECVLQENATEDGNNGTCVNGGPLPQVRKQPRTKVL